MECPNCGQRPPQVAHGDGCFAGVLLHLLQDRGHDLSGVNLKQIDTDVLWGRYGGPAADWLAGQLGLSPYPEDDSDGSGSAPTEDQR